MAKKDEKSEARGSPEEKEGRVFVQISKASFLWGSFDPEIRGVPPITRAGVEMDASHRNSVQEKADEAGVMLVMEER